MTHSCSQAENFSSHQREKKENHKLKPDHRVKKVTLWLQLKENTRRLPKEF